MASAGRFQVVSRIGAGGFATVYRALLPGSQGQYAVKVLAENHSGDPAVRERFLLEARVLKTVAGPGIVAVHDVGVLPTGQPYLVMDLADRGNLQDQINGPLSYDSAVILMVKLGVAMMAAHSAGVVHRDLKPANVLIRSAPGQQSADPAEHEVLVADFGLARALSEATRLTTIAAGTPAYMAPEQHAERADLRTDVYALGVIAYQLLSGRLPFAQHDFGSMLSAKLAETYPALTALRPEVPPAVASVVSRSLSAYPDRRPPTAEAWVEGFVATALGDAAVNYPPPSVPDPTPDASPVKRVAFSPYARIMAMQQLREWKRLLDPAEFAAAKARKLREVGLFHGRAQRPAHVSPYSQQSAVAQANQFASLVSEGVLTESEHRMIRGVMLEEQGLT